MTPNSIVDDLKMDLNINKPSKMININAPSPIDENEISNHHKIKSPNAMEFDETDHHKIY